jgi:opacity protein-like surface antigen
MYKKSLLWTFVLSILAVSVVSAAPDRTNKTDIGVNVGAAIPSDSETDTALSVSGSVSHGFNEWFALGFSGGWENFGTDTTVIGNTTIPGPDITGVPLFADFIFRIPANETPLQGYGVVGLGTVIWSIDDVTATVGGVAVNTQTDVDTEFAVKVGGGADWFLNENWAINFEAAYIFSNPEAEITASALGASDAAREEVDLDFWTATVGVKYLFS